MRFCCRTFLVGIIILCLNTPVFSQQFTPTVDAEVDLLAEDGPFLDETGEAISIHQLLFANIDRRGILEYDVSSLPANAIVDQASIVFEVQSRTFNDENGGPNLRLFAYAGDGLAQIADVTNEFPLVATGDDISALGTYEIQLDVIPLQAILDGGNEYLGFQIQGSLDWQQAAFYSNEDGIRPPATLFLSIAAVPEPSSALAGLGLLIFAVSNSRRRIQIRRCRPFPL